MQLVCWWLRIIKILCRTVGLLKNVKKNTILLLVNYANKKEKNKLIKGLFLIKNNNNNDDDDDKFNKNMCVSN